MTVNEKSGCAGLVQARATFRSLGAAERPETERRAGSEKRIARFLSACSAAASATAAVNG